ncbi:serine/threonine-protein kinase pelle isoform X3 [Parasteatoda tepidariorum]|uniref:serine/threonine-protein kinase pelle isoform X3 n=2 Tax=Parasteatoda tepidariorum TaxID=114398 RepID=UPI001C71A4B4|nr:pelle-like serine/threonine-protein kinase pik-1 isoform X2 [Parasteatoda tepidariorum]
MSQHLLDSRVVYIHDLPYQPRKALCDILDADKSWEKLGGHLQYDVTTLILIGQSVYRDKSPTSELLNKFSEKNGTIKHLFVLLAKMDHQRAMSVLRPYVEEKYHIFLRNDSTYTVANMTCSKKGDIPRPSISQLLLSSTQSYSSASHKSSVRSSCQGKGCSNLDNFNQQFSDLSLDSKVLNVPKEESHCMKMSPNINVVKKQYSDCKEESISDNCLYDNAWKQGKNCKMPSQYAFASPPEECLLPDVMRIPFKDICKATKDFSKDRVLGKGGFGTVYKGEWKGTSVAIKRLMPRQSSQGPSQQLVSLKQSLNELNVLKCCRFDHILPLYAVSLDGENPCLVYQLMVNGSLEDRLFKNKTPALTWSQRSHIAECVTKGLNYLHTTPGKPLCHGDIKSANILLDGNMDAKIGDFGLTREGPGCEDTHVKVSSVHGTECYLPSEYLRHRHLSPQVDIFSYGIVLLEIATGLRPFDPKRLEGKRLADHVRISDKSGHLDALRDTKAGEENMIWFRELIQIGMKCSSEEKRKRPPMQEVLEQFEKIREEMFKQEKIRRLSNEKGASIKSFMEADLSPLDIQRFYDLQNDVNHTVPKGDQSISERGGDLAKENTQCSTNNNEASSSAINNQQKPPTESNPVAPLPLLTVLQLQVSEMSDDSSPQDSYISNSSSYSFS